ncbi:hypothetical protein HDV00_002184 [Rhizophlyctis rosea]|nr:hypothetical protein HDV00_002184 [Rhizophlyctis rosea]
MSVKSLADKSTEVLFESFTQAAHGVKSTFCCGGTVYPPKTTPTTIWYNNGDGTAGSLVLPIEGDAKAALKPILSISGTASFGRGGDKVYDPTYRTALKIEPSQFATSFDLSYHGILEEVRTLMMPTHSSIRAQLYKLNAYGEGGHFKAHVDTPVGGQMFGSLVVCLPVKFDGGKLVVKQKNKAVDFDWAEEMRQGDESNMEVDSGGDGAEREDHDTDPKQASSSARTRALRWAAFYSDCEHSIQPVTSGHRLTLTYNLFINPTQSPLSTITPSTLPLYNMTKTLLSLHNFMPKGGRLGFGCQHVYPHTSEGFCDKIEAMLKGVDMTIWQCMGELGLNASLCPVYIFDEDLSRSGSEDEGSDEEGGEKGVDLSKYQDRGTYVGDGLHAVRASWHTLERRNYREIEEVINVGRHDNDDIVWCVPVIGTSQVAGSYMTYGNEPGTEFYYSAAAIVVDVPSWADRNGVGEVESQTMEDGGDVEESSGAESVEGGGKREDPEDE